MIDKELQEQNEKVASKDDFPINWVDRISLFLSHTIKYLIPVIVIVMMYEIFMRYVLFKPTLWANELCLWLAGVCYLVGGCLLYTSPSPRDYAASRMPSSA